MYTIIWIKHPGDYVVPSAGNATEEESSVFNEISDVVILVSVLC
jgi:hypothetical protein